MIRLAVELEAYEERKLDDLARRVHDVPVRGLALLFLRNHQPTPWPMLQKALVMACFIEDEIMSAGRDLQELQLIDVHDSGRAVGHASVLKLSKEGTIVADRVAELDREGKRNLSRRFLLGKLEYKLLAKDPELSRMRFEAILEEYVDAWQKQRNARTTSGKK